MRWLSQMKEYVDDKVIRSCVWVQTLRNEKGQGLVEYALILVLIAIVVIAALTLLAGKVNNSYNKVGNAL